MNQETRLQDTNKNWWLRLSKPEINITLQGPQGAVPKKVGQKILTLSSCSLYSKNIRIINNTIVKYPD